MTVTIKSKTPSAVPPSVRRRAGIKTGARVEECTPEQRRRINARLAESEADLEHGRTHGPFATHEDMMAFLKDDLAKQRHPAAWGEFDAWIATNGYTLRRHFPSGGTGNVVKCTLSTQYGDCENRHAGVS